MLKKFRMSKYKLRLILLLIENLLLSNNELEIEEEKEKIKNVLYCKILGLLM